MGIKEFTLSYLNSKDFNTQGIPHNTGIECGDRKHTPIASEAQQGLFGAELARRRAGKKSRMKGITTAELESHLHESKGKNLPKRA